MQSCCSSLRFNEHSYWHQIEEILAYVSWGLSKILDREALNELVCLEYSASVDMFEPTSSPFQPKISYDGSQEVTQEQNFILNLLQHMRAEQGGETLQKSTQSMII